MNSLFKTVYQDKPSFNLNYRDPYLHNDYGIAITKEITNQNTEEYITVKNMFKEDSIKCCTKLKVKNLNYKNDKNYDYVVEYRQAYTPILSLDIIKEANTNIVKDLQKKLRGNEHIQIDIIPLATNDEWYIDYKKNYKLLEDGVRVENYEGDAMNTTLKYFKSILVDPLFNEGKEKTLEKLNNNSFRNCTSFTQEKYTDYCFDTTIRVKLQVDDRNKADELIDMITENFKHIAGDNFLVPKEYNKGILLTHLITEKDRDKMIKDKRSTPFWNGNNILSSKEILSILKVLDIN